MSRRRGGSSLSLLIAHGVTTVRDLGDHEELLAWRRQNDAGTRIGPRLLIAGGRTWSADNARTSARDRRAEGWNR